MIFVDRAKVPRPKWFGSPEWGKAQGALIRHFSTKASARSQTRTTAVAGPLPKEVEKTVWALFEGRCAICESEMKPGPASVKRFRPVETEDSKDRYAFAYAALLWENLILLCPNCDRARGDCFPVAGSPGDTNERLRQMTSYLGNRLGSRRAYDFLVSELAAAPTKEAPSQIDPTVEQPADFLIFENNGRVRPTTGRRIDRTIRGEATIKIFQLNRSDLIGHRVVANRRIGVFTLEAVPKSGRDVRAAASLLNGAFEMLQPLLDRLGGEFQAAQVFHTVRWLRSGIQAPLADVLPLLKWPLRYRQFASRVLVPVWVVLAKEKVGRKAKGRPTRARLAPSTPVAARSFSRQRITRVRLKNFRHFREAAFTLPPERPDDAFGPDRQLAAMIRRAGLGESEPLPEPEAYCGWKMLLGENGVGKSSILHAIALAFLADEAGTTDAIASISDLRRSLPADVPRGSIEVWIEGRVRPIRVTFTAKKVSLVRALKSDVVSPNEPKPILFLRGYGAARLLPPRAKPGIKPGTEVVTPGEAPPQEVRNLFNPHFPLADPSHWLQALDDEARHLAFITLKDLLDLPAKSSLAFQDWHGENTFGLIQGGRFIPLEFFSAGYQSIVALGCDIMAGFGKAVGDMQKRAGLVLLDEIGTNLHPRWRLRIVQALRRAFPLFQFVASTHEPLCLRGLGKGEVALLTLEGGPSIAEDGSQPPEKPADVLLRDDLPSPAIYRVDQLLTGDFFGLQTAYDPDEEAAFDAYHALLVKEREMVAEGAAFPPEHAALLERLRARLKDRLNLGDTVAERQLMAALEVAEVLQSNKSGGREPLKGSREAKAAATRLLHQLSPGTSPKP